MQGQCEYVSPCHIWPSISICISRDLLMRMLRHACRDQGVELELNQNICCIQKLNQNQTKNKYNGNRFRKQFSNFFMIEN